MSASALKPEGHTVAKGSKCLRQLWHAIGGGHRRFPNGNDLVGHRPGRAFASHPTREQRNLFDWWRPLNMHSRVNLASLTIALLFFTCLTCDLAIAQQETDEAVNDTSTVTT